MIEETLCEARQQIRSIVAYVRNLMSDALVQNLPIRTIFTSSRKAQ